MTRTATKVSILLPAVTACAGLQCMVGAGEPYCADVDECTDPRTNRNNASYCGANALCTNSIGSFSCACLPGFEKFLPEIGCSDIDE